MTPKIIKNEKYNGFPLTMTKYEGTDGSIMYTVSYPLIYDGEYDDDDEIECEDLEEAMKLYEEMAMELKKTPNWEAQARYDEEHGTDNGFSPWQLNKEY